CCVIACIRARTTVASGHLSPERVVRKWEKVLCKIVISCCVRQACPATFWSNTIARQGSTSETALECKECGQKAYKSVSAAAAKVSATVKEKLQRISSCVCVCV
ncbi:AGAP012086-PA, partial [Anopheles gambiae str. PEST]